MPWLLIVFLPAPLMKIAPAESFQLCTMLVASLTLIVASLTPLPLLCATMAYESLPYARTSPPVDRFTVTAPVHPSPLQPAYGVAPEKA